MTKMLLLFPLLPFVARYLTARYHPHGSSWMRWSFHYSAAYDLPDTLYFNVKISQFFCWGEKGSNETWFTFIGAGQHNTAQ